MAQLRSIFALFFLTTFFFIIGCSDDNNPVKESDTDHDHAEAVGCIISSSVVELARYEKGAVTGQLQVKAGEETPLLSIVFIAEDGDVFQPEENHYKLAWDFSASDIAEIEQHDEDGRWRFHLKGKNAGNTDITFKVLHGDHADFVAKPIPVQVVAQ